MREKSEIKFRGKFINTGEWIYGYFKMNKAGDCYIEDENGLSRIVDPETVCQMVYRDEKGTEYYEGDYLNYSGPDGDSDLTLIEWGDRTNAYTLLSVVNDEYYNIECIGDYVVAGNIFDPTGLPENIYVLGEGSEAYIAGDKDIYRTPEEFFEAVKKDDGASEYLEGQEAGPDSVDTYFYAGGWVLSKRTEGSTECWCLVV